MTKQLIATLCLLLSTASAFTGNTQFNRPVTSLSPSSLKLNTSRRNASQVSKRSRASSSTQLQMSAVPIGAFAGILTGGAFAGGLHAIAGEFRRPKTIILFFLEGSPVTARPPRRRRKLKKNNGDDVFSGILSHQICSPSFGFLKSQYRTRSLGSSSSSVLWTKMV